MMMKNVARLLRRQRRLREFRRLSFDYRHLEADIVDQIERWFRKEVTDFKLDGDRSVRIPHPLDQKKLLKIKGAGLLGRGVRFERRHRPEPRIPLFDFEGRMMEDHAAGYDAAPVGGASFQQCANEYEMSHRLSKLGYRTLPCLGYGRIDRRGRSSWFCVFEVEKGLEAFAPPEISMAVYADAHIEFSRQVRELACEHSLIGHYWYVAKEDGQPVIKDLHAFRHADPISMSRTSWTMHVFHALHLTALSGVLFSKKAVGEDIPADFPAHVFRAFYPGATKEDHDQVRWQLVPQFMKEQRTDFDPQALDRLLKSHPLTSAILDACPPQFAPYADQAPNFEPHHE